MALIAASAGISEKSNEETRQEMGNLLKNALERLKYLFHPLYKEFCGKISREEADEIVEMISDLEKDEMQRKKAAKQEVQKQEVPK